MAEAFMGSGWGISTVPGVEQLPRGRVDTSSHLLGTDRPQGSNFYDVQATVSSGRQVNSAVISESSPSYLPFPIPGVYSASFN